MIEIQNLTKRYGEITAIEDVTFSVNKGEILGFLGPNGAGKSTTMNIITGYIPSTSGTVTVDGYDIMDNPKEVKKRIGYLPELPPLYLDMTVTDFLDFCARLKEVDKKVWKSQKEDIMELVKITHVRHRLIRNLSKGYKQRVGLAQALVGAPEVLILDEPTVGLDPKQIIEIRKLIKALGKNHTIILSSHILPEVSAVCERVVIINKGKIVAVDTPENLSKNLADFTKFRLTVSGPDKKVKELIQQVYGVKYLEVQSTGKEDEFSYIIEADKEVDVRKPIFYKLAQAGYPILELRSLGLSLEEIFLQLTTEEKEVN
ncbi:ABC transporter-like protein [Thermoclostridium stercorarium subsp. stercorarium DSM 8532]|jgi:ABC-2 type transport system ATP-binding protein|uniref:ABC transporter-like protein n=3 Tax=Thermoclostridium stercorarium TaxID=1510 RepID=L7VMQ3_THES1|nr:ATP-binding cassette domain-containing protein [Thermoclostridium stercorarium]AGC67934.1 ABC transporter-like protein [Thermoclostridium stercorarium subsp. stercorarium DSM 8532]AGI38970.1 ABC transporter ATPase subunit [Thermoclostridium stercorarium subsp. stercorarium DSM 8532]ANW98338.1 ABC transporter [Thermoclostridium stercorarium subsp. thermolacticum DSM 2910]ANX00865.1 ABC transporter [Thermoclostridium stercorarium subsp. leptospartum DSM 9219]